MNEYYRQHIKAKIGYDTTAKDTQQVKVTFVKNLLTYEDSRFTGIGLLEYFVKTDHAYATKEQ